MKLTYATDFDSTDLNNWSGLGHYYGVMLENAGFDLNYLNNIISPFHVLHLIKHQIMKRVLGKIYLPHFNFEVSKAYAQIIQNKISPGSSILSPNTVVLANLNNRFKRVLYADATFELLLNLYPNYSKLSNKSIIDAHEVDRRAIQNCDLLIYSSQWAADSAINYYHADPNKIFIAPFGANLEMIPGYSDIKSIIKKRGFNNEVHILFLGVDWKRKGGKIALEVMDRLKQNGLKVTLHIVGIKDELPFCKQPDIINHGFIRKDSMGAQEKLAQLFAMCHFLLLPSIADCTPVVFSEASAYGLPCITTNVGGNNCIVQNDVNGKVFELLNFTDEAVNFILKMINSDQTYEQLCFSSYDRYCSELNWTTTGKKIYKLVNEL